jgi:alpha-mannosidase
MKKQSSVTVRSIIIVFWIANLFLMPDQLVAWQAANGIKIHILDSSGSARANEAYLNGYRKTVDGQTLEYHSSHPDAGSALLVRAQKETHSISWETDSLISLQPGDYYKFVWLAGIEKSGWGESAPVHAFTLFINDEQWFVFKNTKDSTAYQWTVKGKDGSELSFKSQIVDKYGDLFGYMFLTLPKKDFPEGSPLILRVDGEEAGSMDWFMTFQYRFNFQPNVRVEPVLLKGKAGDSQMLRLSLDNLRTGRTIEMETPAGERIKKPLNIGANIFMLPIPVVITEQKMPLEFSVIDGQISAIAINVTPVKKRDVYLLCYSHNDIGYTDLQPAVERKQWDNLDKSLVLIDQTLNYPPEARYKWNLEILWPLESYLKNASEQKRLALLNAIRNGSIGLNALYVNPLTGLANSVEMSHYLDYAREFTEAYSISITSAVVSDIPGFTWGLVPALAQSGVKYFSSSPNNGDRVGHIYNWGDKPFYWTSQSGNEKILFWMAGAGYSSFHEGQLSQLGDEKILKLVRKLDETGYPYEMYQLPYTQGDNGGPDSALSDYVKGWNERYSTPRLIIATHEQMFTEFEKRYGSNLPSFGGDFTPYWEDGAMSTAFETVENRRAVDRLIQGEAIWSLRTPEKFPQEDYIQAWRTVSLWDEHTWGASNSVAEPDSPGVVGQWKIKKQFAADVDSMSRALLAKALSHPAHVAKAENIIDVYNTNSWQRTDIVYLTPEQSSAGDLVIDGKGKKNPSQRLSTGELAVLVRDIQPMSAKRFSIRKGKAFNWGSVRIDGPSMENGFVSVSIDSQTGTISSIRSREKDVEFVDTKRNSGMNRYIYVPGKNADSSLYLTNVKVSVKERGNLVASFLIEGDAPGCKGYRSEIRLVDGMERIDITDDLNKLPVRTSEAVHFAFPFNIPGGEIRYDVANGVVRPEKDQLSGACKNFFSVQSWADASNDTFGITLAVPDVPLIEIGSITAEQPWMKTIQSSSTLYSYVMNNYWHTNYKADQEGLVTLRYAIMPHKKFDAGNISRFGIERRQPLITAVADTNGKTESPLFSIDSPDIIALSVKPLSEGEGWLLYLYNAGEQSRTANIIWKKNIPIDYYMSDPSGARGKPFRGAVTIAAEGSRYIRVKRK